MVPSFEVPVLSRSFRTLKTIHERELQGLRVVQSGIAQAVLHSPCGCGALLRRLFLSASAFALADRPRISQKSLSTSACLPRKEVIQPHLPIRLPCYDFTPVAYPTFGHALLAVRLWTSGVTNSHGVTGGVYKARERIHRGMLIRDY